jgi:hypothetical protein
MTRSAALRAFAMEVGERATGLRTPSAASSIPEQAADRETKLFFSS